MKKKRWRLRSWEELSPKVQIAIAIPVCLATVGYIIKGAWILYALLKI